MLVLLASVEKGRLEELKIEIEDGFVDVLRHSLYRRLVLLYLQQAAMGLLL
jgi:hypothetical protein